MTRTIDDLVETLRKAKDRGRKCTLLVGAGCSVKSGIPTAAGFVDIIRSEYPQAYGRARDKTYPACMNELALSERRDLIARYVDTAKINWAHICIAQLMKYGYVDRVLTTNFDSLIVRACALLGLFPAAYDFAVSQVLKPGDLPDMAIFYLHGQRTGFVLMNTKEQCEAHSKLLGPLFDNAGQGRVWLVVGYSGENDPVFDHLAATNVFDNNLYWVGYKQEEPKKHVREKLLVEGKYAFHTSGYDADDFFVTVAQKLGCFPPDFVTRPFPYLESLLSMVTPYSLPGEGMEMDLLESARQKIQAAVDHDRPLQEGGASTGETEKPVSSLIEEARQLLVAGEYDKMLSLQTSKETIGNLEYTHLIAWAHVMQGNILDDQARTKSGAEADRLWTLAGEKNAAALAIKPDMHEALYNWGLALANQAETKSGVEADRLFSQTGEKYAATIAINPDFHEAYDSWAGALLTQAEGKSKEETEDLLRQAEEHARKAESLAPGAATYNLACIEARKRNEDSCRAWLIKCKEFGMLPSREHLLQDPDLSSVRQLDWFQSFLD